VLRLLCGGTRGERQQSGRVGGVYKAAEAVLYILEVKEPQFHVISALARPQIREGTSPNEPRDE
jgi:hypothetical protein